MKFYWVGCLAALALYLNNVSAASTSETAVVPVFEVDPFWPRIPGDMLIGDVSGVSVDAEDNVWIVHRPKQISDLGAAAETNPPQAICCKRAPPVMKFSNEGHYLRGWGGPGEGYDWPQFEHGLHIDYKGALWLACAMSTKATHDNQLLKFTQDGKFLLQIGTVGKSKGSGDTQNLGGAADMVVYPKTNELFVADGYVNRRVIVFDSDTGAYKRMWGAYGHAPDDTAPKQLGGYGEAGQQFWLVHGIGISRDGQVYVADRRNNRVQVFSIAGKFIKEGFIARETRSQGSAFGIAFSPDAHQRFLYVPDASNGIVHILDRDTLRELDTLGRWGPYAGQFRAVHSVAVDSKGNLYTTEVVGGQRVQKWLYRGLKTVAANSASQSVPVLRQEE